MTKDLAALRTSIRALHIAPEHTVLKKMMAAEPVSHDLRERATRRATQLVEDIRTGEDPGIMEVFLAEYGLSTDEGVALMCLAEALLRVPDAETIDALIEDKIAPSAWGAHLGQSSSSLVNASTWALMLTGKVLTEEGEGVSSVLHRAVKRVGEPIIRAAVQRAMKELGAQFVLGETIEEAVKRGRRKVSEGFSYSFDMLGEAALTRADAEAFFAAYSTAIAALKQHSFSDDIRENPGISVKLSALHPRYEVAQSDRCVPILSNRLLDLCRAAKEAGIGLNVDAEEADRLDLSLDIIESTLTHPDLAGWDGFGVVVQAFGKRSMAVLDWLHTLAETHDRKLMVRLVKGAYWDTEIKRAQVEGLQDFPVFTHKAATDVAYICCAKHLLGMTDRIYPQFATHNAHTVATILEMQPQSGAFEFQRLHGMGEALHNLVHQSEGTRCRIYAPVGAHRDLLAYLVRRLLENGANSSFVNQIVDEDVPASEVAADPFAALPDALTPAVTLPKDIFAPRLNSRGWDITDINDLKDIDAAMQPFMDHQWHVTPLIATEASFGPAEDVGNPADTTDRLASVVQATEATLEAALTAATPWDAPVQERAAILRKAADLYEQNFGSLFAALTREAGKTRQDAIAEMREAVDFLRFYADEAVRLEPEPLGLFACISPWNFPLAIFTGQIAAALAAGNGVLAKPAEPTPITASIAIGLLHDAGVPRAALQCLPGAGAVIGAGLSSDPRIAGLAFTGSTATAQRINRAMAQNIAPSAPLIAETGGLNAMIVDSTALPEQAVRDIVVSAFQSAGQRCSALRVLYVQKDVSKPFLEMLLGAMEELRLGDPKHLETDVGPVITAEARTDIQNYIDTARAEGRLVRQLSTPTNGHFIGPAVISVNGIEDLTHEVFGPVLHIATFEADELDSVVDAINSSGYGLTFGMHSRIDDRVEQVTARIKTGNIYINRNQIGAIVGSQPFGGEGLSGTGPKAGGPKYVSRFGRGDQGVGGTPDAATAVEPIAFQLQEISIRQEPLETTPLPGPTGESNRLSTHARGVILCLGPSSTDALEQAEVARSTGCHAIMAAGLSADALVDLEGIQGAAFWGGEADARAYRKALAARDGALVPLITAADIRPYCTIERHICIDTTAAGGNASLLAGIET